MIVDLAIVIAYLVAITVYGIVVGRKSARTQEGYFLGGRNFGWMAIGFSLYATNISTTQFMSTSGLAQKIGLASINNDLIGAFLLAVSAVLFIPLYVRSGLCTMTEFLERRYGREAKLIYSVTYLLQSALTMPMGIYIGAIAVLGLFNLSNDHLVLACLLIGGSVGLYSVLGGLTAVVKTDVVQAILMTCAGLLITGIAIVKAGGWSALHAAAGPERFELLQPHGSQMPWTALPGVAIASTFFAFCNVGMLQRVLGARDVRHAQCGMLFAAFLKLLCIPLFALPGIAAIQLFPDAGGDQTYALMVRDFLPVGLSGLVLAGLLSAMLSSADSSVCAISSVVAYDIHPLIRPNAPVEAQLRFGKWTAAGIILFGVALAPLCAGIENVYLFTLRMFAFMFQPIGVCFLFGRFVRRVNNAGAVVTMIAGLVLGFAYVLCSSLPPLQWLVPDWIGSLHFYELLPFFWLVLVAILFGVSLATPPPPLEKLAVLELAHEHPQAGTSRVPLPFWRTFGFWLTVFLVMLGGAYAVF